MFVENATPQTRKRAEIAQNLIEMNIHSIKRMGEGN